MITIFTISQNTSLKLFDLSKFAITAGTCYDDLQANLDNFAMTENNTCYSKKSINGHIYYKGLEHFKRFMYLQNVL